MVLQSQTINLLLSFLNAEIHNAVRDGKVETVQALIKAGADVNTQNKGGTTPLHDAVWHGHTDIVDLIKAHQAKEITRLTHQNSLLMSRGKRKPNSEGTGNPLKKK